LVGALGVALHFELIEMSAVRQRLESEASYIGLLSSKYARVELEQRSWLESLIDRHNHEQQRLESESTETTSEQSLEMNRKERG
jgi:hypothetical protein